MTKHLSAAMMLSIAAMPMPADAERIVFEGSFSTYTECFSIGFRNCSTPLTVTEPYTFTLEVPSGAVNFSTNSRPQTYLPPFLAPALVTDGVVPSAETFGSLSERKQFWSATYFTEPVPLGLRWNFNSLHVWEGIQFTEGMANRYLAAEHIDLHLTDDFGRSETQPPTFAELIQLFDHAMTSRTDIPVSSDAISRVSEQLNPATAHDFSKSVTGTFRVVAIQCRTPKTVLDRLRASLGG